MRAPDLHRRPRLASDRKDRAYPPRERRPATSRLIDLFPGKGKEKNAQEAEPATVSDRTLQARPSDTQGDSGIGNVSYTPPMTTGGGKPRPSVSPVISCSSSSAGASPIMQVVLLHQLVEHPPLRRQHACIPAILHPCCNNLSAHPITNASKSTNMPASDPFTAQNFMLALRAKKKRSFRPYSPINFALLISAFP